jgi:hypothetical protein
VQLSPHRFTAGVSVRLATPRNAAARFRNAGRARTTYAPSEIGDSFPAFIIDMGIARRSFNPEPVAPNFYNSSECEVLTGEVFSHTRSQLH